ncbi:EAL domain-containing protein [Rhodoferax sp.]|uniref:bifunctional diguanylate cyclase/phosphodiesterase n=1 Tax=Rhodoferax sp. TaxID=50421 RepID=UPI002603102B|nr:EAL domain-containing protein [Rhodoferax sp.]MDD2924862.1 EAL domain-containing protein [Rhodoferax sp.]
MFRGATPASRFLFIPWIFLLLGLALTYVLQDGARTSARQALQGEFDFRVDEVIEKIENRLHRYEQVLEGAAGLFSASRQVHRQEFVEYVRALKLEGKYPGIQGVGFSRLVLPQERASHVASARAEGYPQYDIRPAGARDIYSSIVYLEPADWRNQRAIGYDMYSEPVRRAAMERSRDEDRTMISGKVQLVQETEQDVQAGFLMYVPVYRTLSQHDRLAERRANLIGWAYAPFRVNDLMSGILGQRLGDVGAALRLEIYDGDGVQERQRLFSLNGTADESKSAFHVTRKLEHFGRSWTVVVHSLKPFDAQLDGGKASVIAMTGSGASLLLALVIWLLVTGRQRAQTMAQDMTGELRQSEAAQRKLNRALRLISECNMALVHAQEEHKLLAEICRLCVESGGYLMAWVGYAEHDAARTVRPIAQSGYENGYLDGIDVVWSDTERGRGPTGTAIRTGLPTVNQNVLSNPAMVPWREAAIQRGYQSSVALPLIFDAQVLGAITMYARAADAFDPEEVQLLNELSKDLAFGIMTLRTRAEHAEAKERLEFLAHFDPLTHLPNRLLLRDRFEHATVIAGSDHSLVALLYLDLDRFKQINDSLGYATGDQVLVMVVERLRQCLPATATVSRVSGDEFAVLLTGNDDVSAVAGVANAIRDVLTESFPIEGHLLNVSCSIGIGLFPGDGEEFDTLLKSAHTAVGNAKEAGRDTYRFFTREMNADLSEQIRLTGGLARAVRHREFRLDYQPQTALSHRRIVGVEALVRWLHPQDGLIAPGKFIPLAERSGHIVQIGEWVLNEACRQGKIWQDQYEQAPVVAVNLSALQFKRGNVLELVSAALAVSGLRPDRLELELTESILLQDVEATIQTLHGLKALGVKLSIDDFGTGYSSLSYLKQLAVDKLKIDQSFVRDMLSSADGVSIVRAIIQLGHNLQLTVIAEGVETVDQLAVLAELGCDEAQGYLFSRPVGASQLGELLDQGGVQLP